MADSVESSNTKPAPIHKKKQHEKKKDDNNKPQGGATSAHWNEPSKNGKSTTKNQDSKKKSGLAQKKCHTIKEDKDSSGVTYTIRCENPPSPALT